MTRVLRNPDQIFARSGLFAMASVFAIAASQPLYAQNSGGGFLLPTPTPTPSTAPQGPADVRAGVPIGPRVIRQATPTPTPAPTPAASQAPSPTPTATARPAPTPTPTATRPRSAPSSAPTPAPSARATPRPAATTAAPANAPASEPRNAGALGAEVPLNDQIAPGFDSIPEGAAETAPVGPDDWYDVSGDEAVRTSEENYAEADSFAALQEWDSTQNRIIMIIGLLALIIGGVALLMWRRRRRESVVQNAPNTALTSGIRKSIADQMPAVLADAPDWSKGDGPARKAEAEAEPDVQPEPEVVAQPEPALEPEPVVDPEPQPEPEPEAEPEAPVAAPVPPTATEPARIDLDLEVLGATRSMMMFTVEFSLEVCNRSDHAVRDLTLAGKLASAQRGSSNAAPVAGGQPIGEIGRIGPQQSQRIAGTLQLPLSEVTPIMQGSKPLLIPLLHLTIEGNGQNAMSRSFVLGTPSAAGTGRVHPLPLDGLPGGLPPLAAQLVKQPDEGDRRSAQTV
ncbi:MAG: hypothetical protein CL955_01045 [Erythrobacteraceae bacterium]|nr:hypothetical protein [Erythrobacteraceae bacterium]